MADKYAIALYLSQRPGRWTSPAEIKAGIPGIPDPYAPWQDVPAS